MYCAGPAPSKPTSYASAIGDVARGPAQGRGGRGPPGYQGRGRGRGPPGPRPPVAPAVPVPKEDYDFEEQNKKFNKDEIYKVGTLKQD